MACNYVGQLDINITGTGQTISNSDSADDFANVPFNACLTGKFLGKFEHDGQKLLQNYSAIMTCVGTNAVPQLYSDKVCGTAVDVSVAEAALSAMIPNATLAVTGLYMMCNQATSPDCGYYVIDTADYNGPYGNETGMCAVITSDNNDGPFLRMPGKCYDGLSWSAAVAGVATVSTYASNSECIDEGTTTAQYELSSNNAVEGQDGCNPYSTGNRTFSYTWYPDANVPSTAPTAAPTTNGTGADSNDTSAPVTPAPVSKAVNNKGVFWMSLLAAVVSVASVF